MPNSTSHVRETAYRDASRTLDYFITGLACLFFLCSFLFSVVEEQPLAVILDTAATVLFALAAVAGLKKLEYYVAILGTEFSIGLAELNQTKLAPGKSSAVLRAMNETIEKVTSRAVLAHHLRSWLLVFGVLALVISRMIQAIDRL